MPYSIRKDSKSGKWLLIRKSDGSIKSHHDTKEKAEAARRAIAASESGYVLRNLSGRK